MTNRLPGLYSAIALDRCSIHIGERITRLVAIAGASASCPLIRLTRSQASS
jgi:hypothetical protein